MEANSSDTEVEDVENIPQIKRRTKTWTFYKSLRNNDELQLLFDDERFWKSKKKVCLKSGEKTFFYCNKSGTGPNRCPAQLTSFKMVNSSEIQLHRYGDHSHQEGRNRMTQQVRRKIEKCVKSGMKHRAISHEIRSDCRFPIKPSKNQVSNSSFICVCMYVHLISC